MEEDDDDLIEIDGINGAPQATLDAIQSIGVFATQVDVIELVDLTMED
jgi:hypothetical protein